MCVDDVVRLGVELWRGCKFYILAEGQKIEFFWPYQVEKAVWYKLFVNLVCTLRHYPSVHPHDSEICDSRLSYLKVIWNVHACKSSKSGCFVESILG